ncbi:EamA family transporter [Streptomyces sp. NPDC001717]|uniref:DMT family transporter n=1 Tax=Streptomyces sp. NPDC001717 TaxID=3364604 RepID=UPI0036B0FF98
MVTQGPSGRPSGHAPAHPSGHAPGGGGGRAVVPALAVGMVVLLSAGWLLSGHLVAGVPPLAVAAGRTATAFVAITLFAVLTPRGRNGVRTAAARPRTVLVLAFLGFFAYYTGTLLGTRYVGASRVGLIVSLLPCITFVVGVLAFREANSRRKVLGTVLAGCGAVGFLLADGAAAAGGGPGTGALLSGGLLAFGGTFTYAFYGYVYRARMADVPALAALPAVTGAGTLMLGLTAVLFVPLGGVSAADWGGVAVLGGVLTAPVFLISHELILRKGPLFTSALGLAVPFLVRLGEWALGSAAAPGAPSVLLIAASAAGVWLTVGGTRAGTAAEAPAPASTSTSAGTSASTSAGTSAPAAAPHPSGSSDPSPSSAVAAETTAPRNPS